MLEELNMFIFYNTQTFKPTRIGQNSVKNKVDMDYINFGKKKSNTFLYDVEFNKLTSQNRQMSLGIGDEKEQIFYTITKNPRIYQDYEEDCLLKFGF